MPKSLKWTNGDSVEVFTDKDSIITKKLEHKERRKKSKELFLGCEGESHTEEIDWGKPEGKEVW